MKTLVGAIATVAALTAGTAAYAAPTLSGEYIEARTCNVYTGACHANGEMVTAGREAMLIWNIKDGTVDGVSVKGLNAVAVVVGTDNLAQEGADRSCVLYVDSRATDAQSKALSSAISKQYGKALGTVLAVKTASIEFKKSGLDYAVRIPNVAYLKTTRYACDHCVMPHSVWYEPFVGLKSSIVAKASLAEFKGAPELSQTWRRADENSSFVGDFSF
jgi:hypothetical protein